MTDDNQGIMSSPYAPGLFGDLARSGPDGQPLEFVTAASLTIHRSNRILSVAADWIVGLEQAEFDRPDPLVIGDRP